MPTEIPTNTAPGVHHFNDLGFQNAMPAVVFDKVFHYLSPGYLWLFCRPVCKAWKAAIEQNIHNFLYRKAFLQIIMSGRQYYAPQRYEDPNYGIYNEIYRFAEIEDDIAIFRPFKKGEELSVKAPIYDPKDKSIVHRDPHWKILDIFSSLYPVERTSVDYYKKKKRQLEAGDVIFWGTLITRPDTLTKEYIHDFNNLHATREGRDSIEPKPKRKVRTFQFMEIFPNVYFDESVVYIEFHFAGYTLKGKFITQLEHHSTLAGMAQANWDQNCHIKIEQITLPLHQLLSWRCCCSENCCEIISLLGPGGQHHPVSTDTVFPYIPCNESDKWRDRLRNVGEPAITAFQKPSGEHSTPKQNRLPTRPNRKCETCLKGIQEGRFLGETAVVNHAPYWCPKAKCRRCCDCGKKNHRQPVIG
jgi:hypothetical protein